MTEIQSMIQQLDHELTALDAAALEMLKGRKGEGETPILVRLFDLLGKAQQASQRRDSAKATAAAIENFSGACADLLTVGNDAASAAELRQRAYEVYLRTVELEVSARREFTDAEEGIKRTARNLRERPEAPNADVDAILYPVTTRIREELTPRFVATGKAKV